MKDPSLRHFLQTTSRMSTYSALACLAPWTAISMAKERPPNFDAIDLAGKQIRLSDYAGQVLYLDFWASWCAPCKISFPWMNEMHAKFGSKGLKILAVNLDKKKLNLEKFLIEFPAEFQIAWDPDGVFAKAYEVKAMPTSVIIGRRNLSFTRHSGFSADVRAQLEADIKSALCSS